MSETINVTIENEEVPISITITEEAPFSVNFYEIALPDPSVAAAKVAAEAAQAAAGAANVLAQAAATSAATSLANIGPVVTIEVQNQLAVETKSLINALIFG